MKTHNLSYTFLNLKLVLFLTSGSLQAQTGNPDSTIKYPEEMDKAGVWMCVSLDANSGNEQAL